ncbi:MAG TPA: hypothetical protein VL221_07705 [Bacteroidota bacterium]|nr:hypothetical protein [Bacteroidota bacterium]
MTSLREVMALSRAMRRAATDGVTDSLGEQMARRGELVEEAAAGLAAMEEGHALPAGEREALAAMLAELAQENALLIQALKERQREIIRCIAEAEGHRKLSAYAR